MTVRTPSILSTASRFGPCTRYGKSTARPKSQLLEQIGQAPGSENNGKGSLDSLTYLSAPEREWLEWFYYLSDEDKKIVEECGENNISVTADNLEQMREIAKEQAANSSGSVVPLFKY